MPLGAQTTRYQQWLRKHFGLQGHVGLNIIDDVLPVMPVIGDADPEARALRQEREGWWAGEVTSAAGQLPSVWVINPAGSNAIVVLEEFSVFSTGGFTYSIGIETTGFPAVGTPAINDPRLPGNPSYGTGVGTSSDVAAITTTRKVTSLANETFTHPFPCVLTPGSAARFQGNGVASFIHVNALGYVRMMTEEEGRG